MEKLAVFQIAVIGALIAATPAHAAPDWKQVGSAKDSSVTFIDLASIRRDGTLVTYWEKVDYSKVAGVPIQLCELT